MVDEAGDDAVPAADEVFPAGDEAVDVEDGDESVEPDVFPAEDGLDELDAEDELDPESVDGAACAKPVPRPRAANPREPAMAVEAASF